MTLSAFILTHGNIPALGYRIGEAAYTPDVSDIPTESWPFLENLDLWIIDGLRYTGHPSHFSVNDALAWIDRFKPRRAVITNMHADLDYEVLRQSLPSHVVPAYDGMRLTLARSGLTPVLTTSRGNGSKNKGQPALDGAGWPIAS